MVAVRLCPLQKFVPEFWIRKRAGCVPVVLLLTLLFPYASLVRLVGDSARHAIGCTASAAELPSKASDLLTQKLGV